MTQNSLRELIEGIVDRRLEQQLAQLLSAEVATPRPNKPAPARWSESDKRSIVEDALSGMSMVQMARKYGRTQGAIRLRLYGKKAGLLRRSTVVAQGDTTQ